MRTETITIYKIRPWRRPKGEWRWRWKAANGLTIGSSAEGYANRAECIANLERITGGKVTLTYQEWIKRGGIFGQGYWTRGLSTTETIFVQVIP